MVVLSETVKSVSEDAGFELPQACLTHFSHFAKNSFILPVNTRTVVFIVFVSLTNVEDVLIGVSVQESELVLGMVGVYVHRSVLRRFQM